MSDALANRPIPEGQLFALIGLLVLGVMPHFWNLDAALPLFFLIAAASKLLLWRKPGQRPSKWLMLLLMPAAILLVVTQVGLGHSHQFGVALLVAMLGLKLLEIASRRDLYVVVILGYFLMVTQFLFNQDPSLTFYLFLLVIGLTAILNEANRLQYTGKPWTSLRRAGLSLLLSLPVMLVLFLLFPRLNGPLWSFNMGKQAISGMSDQISLGSVSQLSLSDEPAFRVEFEGDVPPPEQRYWRGLVLWKTDGRNWIRDEAAPVSAMQAIEADDPVSYRVTMEDSGQPWLFPLDRNISRIPGTRINADGEVIARKSIDNRYSYRAVSTTDYWDPRLTFREKRLGLQLPDRGTERMRSLVARWRNDSDNDRELVQSALRHFNTQPFVYTLEPPPLGKNPVDQFLFETRQGFCEHYATSFVVLMRMAGIPARVIGGYQGGEINPLGGHLLVRQADAHAWAEVWFDDEGWIRVDPTAAVAPERIRLPLNPQQIGEGYPALFYAGDLSGLAGLLRKWGWIKGNMIMQWQRWVVGFDQRQQRELLRDWGLEFLQGAKLGFTAVAAMLLAALLGFLATLIRNRRHIDPAVRQYRRFLRKLRRAGIEIPAHLGPLDTGNKASEAFPRQRGAIQRIVDHYIRLRYRDERDRGLLRELHREVRKLKLG